MITIDGTSGDVIVGEVPLVEPARNRELEVILEWADELRTLGVHANADTPADAAARGRTVPRASGSAGPSTCSWPTTGSRSSAR